MRNRSSSRERVTDRCTEYRDRRSIRPGGHQRDPNEASEHVRRDRAAPGMSPTSPSSGTVTTVSAFGSGTNENEFLIDGTNFTCPCNGIAEPSLASTSFRKCRFSLSGRLPSSATFRAPSSTSSPGREAPIPVRRVVLRANGRPHQPADSASAGGGHRGERIRARPVSRSDDQPWWSRRSRAGLVLRRLSVPARLRQSAGHRSEPSEELRAEQDFAKLTWQSAPDWRLDQSLHHEIWVNSEQPTLATPYEATLRVRDGTSDDLRPPDAYVVRQHAVGRPRRALRLLARRRPRALAIERRQDAGYTGVTKS